MNLEQAASLHRDRYCELLKKAEFTLGRNKVAMGKWMAFVLKVLSRVKKNGHRVYLIGNGASCSMASHFAADFTKNAGINSFSVNEGALLTCFSNDFSFETAYMEILKRMMKKGDVLIAISSSGKSKNILNALKVVKKSPVITLTGFARNNPLRRAGTHNLYLPVNDYGPVESGHAYFLHLIEDLFNNTRIKNG